MKYADIAFRRHTPAANDGLFTFAIPEALAALALPGCIVRAPFKGVTEKGLIVRLSDTAPSFATQAIDEVCSPPLLSPEAFFLAESVAGRNFVPLARVLPLLVPNSVFEHPAGPPPITLFARNATPAGRVGNQMQKALGLLEQEASLAAERLKAEGITAATLKRLQEKELITASYKERFPLQPFRHPPLTTVPLSTEQQRALEEITKNGYSLLFAPTGSGKSHLLRQLALSVLDEGQTVFFLLPEIGLTAEALAKSIELFGKEHTVLYHSRLSESEKAEAFWRIRAGHARVIVGSRAALFLPFRELGLIVMEEEHEWSFKSDQSPRYHARDVALRLAGLFDARLVFATATPSLELYHETKQGRFPLVKLPPRFPPPQIVIADLKEELTAKNPLPVSRLMQSEITRCLEAGRQVLLFLNRRGLYRALVCRECGELSRCPQCGIALVVHHGQGRDILLCHQCGRVFGIPSGCGHCGNTALQYSGAGTARIEAVITSLYPGRRVIRIDRDTTTGKGDFAELHEQFQSGAADILVGTQIVAKGLDYENIGLVGILDADAGLNIPDFRAAERSFQLLQQVAGRAGRRGQSAKVVLQTRLPKHPLFAALQAGDTIGFYEQELKTRERFFLPPFSRVAKLIFGARTKEIAYRRARETEAALRIRLSELKDKENAEISVAPALNPQKHGKYFVNLLVTAKEPERLLALVGLHGARIDIDPADVVS